MKPKKRVYILLIIIILALVIFKIPHNFKISYKVKNLLVKEEYNKKLKIHYLTINKDKKTYEFITDNKGRKVIKDIDYFEHAKNKCLGVSTKEEKLRPICYNNDTLKDIALLNDKEINKHYKINSKNKDLNITYNNVTIHNLNNASYLLWNYRGFYYLKNNVTDNIKITDKDVYNLKVITRINNLLLLADYQEEYQFNKFIILNLENGKKVEWEVDYDISMDSYILGSYNKSVYLVDKKSKIEYEIVPSYKKIRIVGTSDKKGIIYNNDFEKIALNKLVKKELSFKKEESYNYKIKNNQLYLSLYNSSHNILITNNKNLKIVDKDKDRIYYLSDNKLFSYSPLEGEKLLLENFEWNFNYENMIFAYKK